MKLFIAFLIMSLISSCAELNQSTKSSTSEKRGIPPQPVSAYTATTIQKAETIEIALSRLKEHMLYKHVYLYDLIMLTSRQNLLHESCFQDSKDIPEDINQYQDFISKSEIDDGWTYSFLRYGSNGYSLLMFRCRETLSLEKFESYYYDCTAGKDPSKCFAPIILPPTPVEAEKYGREIFAIKKDSRINICKKQSDTCDFFNDLSIFPKEMKDNLTTKEKTITRITITKVKKVKAREREIENLVIKKEKLAEEQARKIKSKYEKEVSECERGKAQTCWILYMANVDKDADLANSFVARSCVLGNKKACMIDERNRQINNEKEQQKIQREAIENEHINRVIAQQLEENRQKQALYERQQQREREREIESEENAQLAAGIAGAISRSMSPVEPASSAGKSCYGDVNCSQGQKCAKQNNTYQGYCINVYYVDP